MGREESTHPILYFCWVENGGDQLLTILLAEGLRKRAGIQLSVSPGGCAGLCGEDGT